MKGRRNNVNAKGRNRTQGGFYMVTRYMLESPAWRDLTPYDRAVYFALLQTYNGRNNGEIGFSVRRAAELANVNKNTAAKCLGRLVDRGFAVCVQRGGFGGDIVVPGAFKHSLAEHTRRGTKVVMLRDHDPREPIGVWTSIKETAKGLEVAGKLTLAVTKARETLALLKDGAMEGLSIGYRTVESTRDGKTGARLLQRVDLHEVSLVAMPMNTSARVVAVKTEAVQSQRDFEQFLRDAGWSRERAKILSKGWSPAADDLRDAGREAVETLAQRIRARAVVINPTGISQ